MRVFKVLRPGLLTTVQDTGRFGYLKYGIPSSGAMDRFSFIVANLLVQNDLNDACLESTLIGPEIQILSKTCIAVTGGDCSPNINGESVSMWETIIVKPDDVLSFGAMRSGCRAYISVGGGIDVPKVLGSRSTYIYGGFGGMKGRQLKTKDVIETRSKTPPTRQYSFPEEFVPSFPNDFTVHIIVGPQAEMFTERGIKTFLSNSYKMTPEANRIGYRFEGPAIEHVNKADIISDAILPGAIQIPGNGKPIVMMRDAQTTGGYSKIAVAVTPDVDQLGQAKSDNTINFSRVTLNEAKDQLAEYFGKISRLKSRIVAM